MKYKYGFLFLFTLVLLASTALAQTGDLQAVNDPSPAVSAARCQYTPADEVCASLRESGETHPADDATVAQFPRRIPSPPARRPTIGRPRPSYTGMWRPAGSGRHALIGALIGCGLGTAIAVRGHTGVRASLALGTLGAGMGAAMGLSIPSFPARSPYRRGPWPDEDEQASSNDQKGAIGQGSGVSGQ
jgi:hypothetical protein